MDAQIRDFVRIPLLCLTRVTHGTYIVSTLSSFARDPVDNYGLTLHYQLLQGEGEHQQVEAKENTYTVETAQRTSPGLLKASLEAALSQLKTKEDKLVFKSMRKDLGDRRAVPPEAMSALHDAEAGTGQEMVETIVAKIQQAHTAACDSVHPDAVLQVEREDIRTLQDAERETTFLTKAWHHIEHRIWW
jgi:hypothetical protein